MSDGAREILDRVVKNCLDEFNGRVEERLRHLIMCGFVMSDLSLKQEGDRLQIWTLNMPDSEFWVQGTETGISINGHSIRHKVDGDGK